MDPHQSYPTWLQSGPPAEVSIIPPNGRGLNRHPHPTFRVDRTPMPPPARPRCRRVRSIPQVHSQRQPLPGHVQFNPTIEESSRLPMDIDFRPGAHPIYYPPCGRERHIPSNYNTPIHTPEIPGQIPVSADHLLEEARSQCLTNPSPDVHTWPSNYQVDTLPQRSPLQSGNPPISSDPTILPTHPADPLALPECAFLIAPSFPHDTGSRATPFSTDACPFPTCQWKFARMQDLERHIHKHLSRCIYCTQADCNWTGSRRCALRDHYKKKHKGVPVPEQGISTIYDAKVLVKQLLKEEITLEQAVFDAHFSFQSKAAEVGKLDIWRE